MENLPKDVLSLIALDMDIEYVIRLCQTSHAFNNKICKDEYFWLNKLKKDYGISAYISKAKKEYLIIKNLLKTEPNVILESGIRSENIKLVEAAIEAGADINRKIGLFYPITLSIVSPRNDIFVYLMNKTDFTEDGMITEILNDIFTYISELFSRDHKCRIFLNLFGILLPNVHKYMLYPKWKHFWRVILGKLEQIHDLEKYCISDEFYKKWIDFYRKLAE